jgi:hypothetical protein
MKYNEYGVPARQSLTARSVADAIREALAPPRATSCTWLEMNELSRSWRCPIPEMATWKAWSLAHRSQCVALSPQLRMMWALGRSARYFRYLTDNERTVTSTWCSTCARPGKRLPQKRRLDRLVYERRFMAQSSTFPEIILKMFFINTGYM